MDKRIERLLQMADDWDMRRKNGEDFYKKEVDKLRRMATKAADLESQLNLLLSQAESHISFVLRR